MADAGDSAKAPKRGAHKFQAPKGTRDFYPEDMLRKRYIVETWRAVSLRHGFEEIDGPTFEHLELYTVKSGEGIVSELFSFRREGGEDTYALRPEFTPTLARMYAARAAQLPKPVRWFCVPSFFRAERPQRGRLREFLQWNCDVVGDDSVASENNITSVTIDCLRDFGLGAQEIGLRMSDRQISEPIAAYSLSPRPSTLLELGIKAQMAMELLDKRSKMPADIFDQQASSIDFDIATFDRCIRELEHRGVTTGLRPGVPIVNESDVVEYEVFDSLRQHLDSAGLSDWVARDFSVVRGLAYYTGMVFEVIAEGERAVAGGGRYDNLIGLLGGPPTPAVGFAMGDVVLANLLDDKKLMPTGAELASAVEAVVRSQRIRPEVLVTSNGDEATEPMVTPLVARLRRGVEAEGFAGKPWDGARYAVRPLHVRTSTKNPKRLNKVLEDAEKQGARFAAIIHGDDKVQLRDLDRREDVHADLHIDPAKGDRFVGRVLAKMLG